jgi:hypothetical protein
MAAKLITLPFRPAINLRGGIEPGAKLEVYRSGTLTPQAIFADGNLTTPLANPLTANSFGQFPDVYWDDAQAIRVVMKQASGVVMSDTDPYIGEASTILVAATAAANTAAAQASAASVSAAASAASASASAASAASAATSASQAQASAADAAQSAAYAGGFETPEYANQSAGEAATTEGQIFRVPLGTSPQTFNWYRRLSIGSELVSPLVSNSLLTTTTVFASVAGEVGVINPFYPVGDVRRYGVFPDGVTNWEGSFPTRIANIFQNSINSLIFVRWPRGLYNTGINLTPTYNGSRMHFDHAVFSNIVHIIRDGATRVQDVHWSGAIYSYDRLGIDSGTNIILPEYVGLLQNAAINPQGTGNRGVHFLACENVSWGLIDVFDTGATSAVLPGAQTIWSGFTIQSQARKGFRGAVRVRNASGHGCYINGLDLDLDIRVEGYGNSAIDLATTLEGADSEAQSELGCGVWLNRCTGKVALHVDQVNASPVSDIYTILFDETGVSTVADSRHKPLEVTSLYATVGNGNRGVCVGEALAPSINAHVAFNCQPDIRLRASAPTLASTYAGFNVLPPSTSSSSYRRVKSALPITFHGFGAVQAFKATTASGTNVYVELDLAGLETPLMAAGRFAQFDGTAGVMRGRVGSIRLYYDAGSTASPVVDVDSCEGLHIMGGELRANSVVNTTAIRFANNVDCTLEIPVVYNFGRTTDGGIGLTTNSRCTFGPIRMDRASVGGEGIRFIGDNSDCVFQSIRVSNFAVGLENGTSMAFTRSSARDCAATGNTDNTDITLAAFPAANQFNCTNWAE